MVWFVLLRFLLAGSGIGLRGCCGHDLSLEILGVGHVGNYTFMAALDAGCATAGCATAGCVSAGCASAGCARTRRPQWSTYALVKGHAR